MIPLLQQWFGDLMLRFGDFMLPFINKIGCRGFYRSTNDLMAHKPREYGHCTCKLIADCRRMKERGSEGKSRPHGSNDHRHSFTSPASTQPQADYSFGIFPCLAFKFSGLPASQRI